MMDGMAGLKMAGGILQEAGCAHVKSELDQEGGYVIVFKSLTINTVKC